MGALAAFRDGIRRVNRAPLLLFGMFLVTLLVALPLSFALRGMIEAHLGRSLAAEQAAAATNYDWWQEFSAQASGLGTTFVPSIIGFGAVLENLSGFLDNLPLASTIGGVTLAWMMLWSFLSGGILDRYARNRPTRSHGFFAACGTHFWRFLRLAFFVWMVYAAMFFHLHHGLFDHMIGDLTKDLSVERAAFLLQLSGYLLFGVLLCLFNVIFDYARIRIVVEDRRSAIGALIASVRFIARHPGSVIGLYLLNGTAFVALVLLYALVSPGAPGEGISAVLTLAIGQLYILARHYLKLLFYASETALFQSALAHSAYTAAPAIVWPDSPSVETITNASPAAVP